jgi:hypothetical protein
MADTPLEPVLVTVDDQHLAAIQTVVDALRLAGLQVTNVMPTTGIISGKVSHDKRQALASVPGVAAVEPDEEMHAI